jgi:chromosome segregation ATPase
VHAAQFCYIIGFMELLFVISLILIALAVGYYFGVRWARQKVQAEARSLTGELRAFENQYRQFLAGLQDYSPEDPEPYGSQARLFQQNADQIGGQLYGVRQQYVHIQERLPRGANNVLQPLRVSPFLLLDLHSEIDQAQLGLHQQREALAQLGKQVDDLGGFGWLTAQQARQASANQAQIEQRLKSLCERRAHGTAFDGLESSAAQAQDRLAQIPGFFLSADQATVLAQADKAAVIQAHQTVSEARALQEQMDAQLKEWEQSMASLDEKLARLRQGISSLDQSLSILPVAVDGSALQSQFESLQTEVQRLQVQASRPELEKLPPIETAADGLIQTAQDTEHAVRQARLGQATLAQILEELSQGLKQASDEYSALGTAKTYRVLWSHTSNTLASLSQRINDLGLAERKRTPEKLVKDLETANQLSLEQKELAAYLQQIADQRAELVDLLEGPELSQAVLWAQNSQKLLQQVREYYLDNWPRADAVNVLPDDLRTVTDGLQRLGTGKPGEGIVEAQLAQHLQEAHQLGRLYQSLRARVSAVEARLVDLQHSETQAREALEGTSKNLTQVGFIVSSNPALIKIAGQEIERFQKQIEKQRAELDQRQQGTVDSKARQASGLVLRIEQGLNDWLNQLDQGTQASVKVLTASLTRLDSIAPLDDAPVAEARRLLSSGQSYGGNAYRQSPQLPVEALVLEFKRRSEYAQTCTATQQALHDLEKPVVESFNTASQGRQQVQDQFNTANSWMRQARAWPPVEVAVDTEFKQLGQIEADWAALKEKPIKAIDLVKRLGDFAREYQALAAKMGQLIERGNREQKDVQKLESELDEYLSLWEKLQKTYQDNPDAGEDIHKLLDEADQEMYRVKTQYREGRLDYAAVYQAIQSLHRKVRLYQAVLDDAHVVDVNGRVIASKETKRAPGEW